MNTELLLTLYKYFARFVPKAILEKTFVKNSGTPGVYHEVMSEVLNSPDDLVIPDFDAYIFSTNEEFLKKKISNSKSTVLYIEYGAFSYVPNQMYGVKEKLAIHVAYPYNASNSDNLNELLIMQRTKSLLFSILEQMEMDQNSLNFCGNSKLIEFPAEVVAVDPVLFYDRAGWMAIFDHSTTSIL